MPLRLTRPTFALALVVGWAFASATVVGCSKKAKPPAEGDGLSGTTVRSDAGGTDDASSDADASDAADAATEPDAVDEPDVAVEAEAGDDAADEAEAGDEPAIDTGVDDVAPEADEPAPIDAGFGPQPVVMQTNLAGPSSMTLDADNVYWADAVTGEVWAAPRFGGAAVKLADSSPPADNLFLDGQNLVWHSGDGSNGVIVTMPKAGGVAPTTLGAGRTLADRTHAIASDATNVYWADVGATQPSSSSVFAIEKSPTATPRALVAGLMSPVAIAVDATALYVAEWGDDTNGGRVFSATLDAGLTATLIGSTPGLSELAIDDTYVYVSAVTSSGVIIERVAKGGGQVHTIWSTSTGGREFAVGPSRVYWDSGGGTLVSMPTAGGAPTQMFEVITPRGPSRAMYLFGGGLWNAFGGGPNGDPSLTGTIEVIQL